MEKVAGGLFGSFESRIIATGLVFLLTLISGIWLSSIGRPLSAPLFTAHKLIALVSTILFIVTVYNLRGGVDWSVAIWVAIAVTAALLVSLFVSGALLSGDRPVDPVLLTMHQIAPVLAPVAAAVTVYLLARGG